LTDSVSRSRVAQKWIDHQTTKIHRVGFSQ
jgi:hypothetical protein